MGRPPATLPVQLHAHAAAGPPPPPAAPPPRRRRRWRLAAVLVVPVLAGPLARAARAVWARRAALAAVRGANAVAAVTATARALAHAALLSVASWALPGGWPVLEAATLVGVLPSRVPLPRRARAAAAALAPPVVARAAAGAVLGAAAPDVARTLRMWDGFLPLYARYRFTKWRWREDRGIPWPRVEAAWERRHAWGAPRVHALLGGLGGYYVKAAQVLAAKGDFIPRAWLAPLSAMFDAMPPRPWGDVAVDLERGLRAAPGGKEGGVGAAAPARHGAARPLCDATFAFIDPVPLATASIAQVHAATLAPAAVAAHGWAGWNGDAVIKIQNARVRVLMDSDVRNLGRLAAFVKEVLPFDVGGLLAEMGQTVPKEFDFVREARLQAALGARLAAATRGRVVAPRALPGLTSRGVLVMERLHGVPLSSIIRDATGPAGPAALTPATLAAARAGVTALIDSYGAQIFGGALFHADPHPGNVLLLTDGAGGDFDGRVGLLDYGQVKALTAKRRRLLARVIIAVDDGDADAVAAALADMGLCPPPGAPGAPPPVLAAILAAVVFDTAPLPAASVNPLDDTGRSVLKMVPLADFPSDLFQVGRTLMLLRGLAHALGVDASSATLWRKAAERALAEPADRAEARAAANKRLDNGDDHPDEDA